MILSQEGQMIYINNHSDTGLQIQMSEVNITSAHRRVKKRVDDWALRDALGAAGEEEEEEEEEEESEAMAVHCARVMEALTWL